MNRKVSTITAYVYAIKTCPFDILRRSVSFIESLQPVYRQTIFLTNLSFFLAENDPATDLTIVPTVKVVKDVINDLK